MFNFLTLKEKGLLLIGPVILVLIILFQGWQATHWHKQAIKESQLKAQWQQAYQALNQDVKKFTEQQNKLIAELTNQKAEHQQQNKELHNALNQHQNWANQPLPADVQRLLNPKRTPTTPNTLPTKQ
ncbi:chemotaxis protein [Avibacterium paragallinarum]|uniref:chemotaxis protein n=1 Tax=Avibacterium paragallinarum TaxID=728 RepID=UPI00397987DF